MLLTANVSVAALLTGIELGVIAALTSARLPVFEVAVFDVVPPDADADPEKLKVPPAEPVTVYVQLKLVLAPAASEASEAGGGPLASVSGATAMPKRSGEHTSELQSQSKLLCRL